MTYVPNTPANSSEDPSVSQPKITANFQAINTFFSKNHVAPNASNEGKHKFIQMPEQSSNPSTAVNEGALFTKQNTYTGNTECYFRRENNGTAIDFTARGGTTKGWSRLASGLLIKWGTTAGSAGSSTYSYPTGGSIPAFTAVYNVQITTVDNSATPNTFVTLKSFNTTGITVNCSARTTTSTSGASYYYLSIGI